jgi:hypothetical protein
MWEALADSSQQGAIFEIFPHEPKKEWKRHGIPVEIRFDPDDDRETSIGALFLDLADEPLPSPYFALFLDSGNALVLRTRHGRPVIAPGEIPGYSATGVDDLDVIVTSSDVLRQTKTRPETKDWVFQAFANTERIGVASFDGIPQRKDEAKDDSPIDLDKLTLDDIVSVPAKESWGLVTKEDPKVRVTII